MSKVCFYVYAPLYQKNSNGIRILYTLSEMIRQCGYESKVICCQDDRSDYDLLMPARYHQHTLKLRTEFSRCKLNEQDIVIYPETVPNNPLNAKNVVRYLLNRPIYLTGEGIDYGDRDYLVSYSLRIDANLPQLFILNDDREYFYPRDFKEKENLVCIYYGKVVDTEITDPALTSLISSFEHQIIITREFPATRVELGDLLRRARLLISLDPISNITYESTLCGTPALIPNDIFGFSTQQFNIPLYGISGNVSGYDEAIKDISLAFEKYQSVILGNHKTVKDFTDAVLNHFEMLSYKMPVAQLLSYRQVIAGRSKSQRELDELRFMVYANSSTLTNQNTLNYLNTIGNILKTFLVRVGFKQSFTRTYVKTKHFVKKKSILSKIFYKG